jgi:hypothetical protein
MSRLDDIRDHVRNHKRGILTDLAFAVVWVTLVEVFFDLTQGPKWAYYMFMLGGIIAYYGFMGTTGVESE